MDERIRVFFEDVLPLLSPGGRPAPADVRRDVGILKTALRKEPIGDVLMVCREVRTQAEYGKLPGFIAPGQAFSLRALLHQGQGPTNYTGFKCEAMKRLERRKAPTSQTVADIFATIASRGRAGAA